jgi:hypothetical protein
VIDIDEIRERHTRGCDYYHGDPVDRSHADRGALLKHVDRLTAERDRLRGALEDLYEYAEDMPPDRPAVRRAREALGR